MRSNACIIRPASDSAAPVTKAVSARPRRRSSRVAASVSVWPCTTWNRAEGRSASGMAIEPIMPEKIRLAIAHTISTVRITVARWRILRKNGCMYCLKNGDCRTASAGNDSNAIARSLHHLLGAYFMP
ncbi:hypothetical protein D3C72_2015500 [compost metagenome]